jgi:hypothetical protein
MTLAADFDRPGPIRPTGISIGYIMAGPLPRQERNGAVFMSSASVFIAGLKWLDRPAPGEIAEAQSGWYVTMTVGLHAAILLLLVLALTRIGRMTEDRPGLRLPFLLMILVGILGAAYVVGRDLGLV